MMHSNSGVDTDVSNSIWEVDIVSGPMINYRLGKMTHREYEAEASKYWRQDVARQEMPILAKRSRRSPERSASALHRVWCATAQVGLSPAGCQTVE